MYQVTVGIDYASEKMQAMLVATRCLALVPCQRAFLPRMMAKEPVTQDGLQYSSGFDPTARDKWREPPPPLVEEDDSQGLSSE